MTLLNENLSPFASLAKTVPGGKVNVSTLWRWAMKGCRGVVLESVLRGGIRMSSAEALARFFEAITKAGARPSPRSAPERRAAVATAAKQLDAAGI